MNFRVCQVDVSVRTACDLLNLQMGEADPAFNAGALLKQFLGLSTLARSLRQHRLKSPDGQDVIDVLIRLLQTA